MQTSSGSGAGKIQFIVKILVIVNESPWSGSLATTAHRLVEALIADGHALEAVFFREEGVYHALAGRAEDAGATRLSAAWKALAARAGFPLLLCSSAAQRRLDQSPGEGFREAGLGEVLAAMTDCDRVVTF